MEEVCQFTPPALCYAYLGCQPTEGPGRVWKALAADGGIIVSGADDALIPYLDIAFDFGGESYSDYRRNALSQRLYGNDPRNNPSFICSTFIISCSILVTLVSLLSYDSTLTR